MGFDHIAIFSSGTLRLDWILKPFDFFLPGYGYGTYVSVFCLDYGWNLLAFDLLTSFGSRSTRSLAHRLYPFSFLLSTSFLTRVMPISLVLIFI